ncbi:MAG: GGDEF domain-containing response regulator [Candidatus Acidiferrales bacterium]
MSEENKPKDRILIAEDDPVSRRVLESFLGKWGYEVTVAADGLEALRLLENRDAPRLAVLDWMMPGLEGVQICKRVREDSTRTYIYILLLSARSQKDDLLQGLQAGADDYLTKPFDAQELRARLHVGKRILELQDNLIAAREKLLFQATHDALTGIANRGVSLDALRREHHRQSREGGSFAVVMLDIDHFKYVNDTYGHPAGDAVLAEAAQRIKSCIRPYDTVGRYGGEEFLIVLPATDALGAVGVAERIRAAVEAEPIVTSSGKIAITVSMGVAVSSNETSVEAEALLQRADEALYRAKEHGRNRVELAIGSEHKASPPTPAHGSPIKTESR